MIDFLSHYTDRISFCLLSLWFAVFLFSELYFIPRNVKKNIRKKYIPKTSYANEQKHVEAYIKRSGIEETIHGFTRAQFKKGMYIFLFSTALFKLLMDVFFINDFDIVMFFSACIAILEAIDSHYLMKEKLSAIKRINFDILSESTMTSANVLIAETDKIIADINKLSPFEKIMMCVSDSGSEGRATIKMDNKKKPYNVKLSKIQKDGKDGFMIDFPERVKYVDSRYYSDSAKYDYKDGIISIAKSNGDKKYSIQINVS